MSKLADIAKIAGSISVIIRVGQEVYEFTEPLHDKLKWWSSSDLEIECPKCGNLQDYTLDNVQEGWFTKYTRCTSCDKKIKLDIEVEES